MTVLRVFAADMALMLRMFGADIASGLHDFKTDVRGAFTGRYD